MLTFNTSHELNKGWSFSESKHELTVAVTFQKYIIYLKYGEACQLRERERERENMFKKLLKLNYDLDFYFTKTEKACKLWGESQNTLDTGV